MDANVLTTIALPSPAERVRAVIRMSAAAWGLPPVSAHALARRAPHGHVPARVLRRLRAAAESRFTASLASPTSGAWPAGIAHSW